jgi:SAM-dependent methyltransferase
VIELERPKPRSIGLASSYRLRRALERAIGRERLLRGALLGAWILRRHAHELASAVIGERYNNNTHGLDADLLRCWIPDGSRVLDVGCGQGRITRLLAPRATAIVAIDHDPATVATARSLGGEIDYRVGDATEVEGEFDVALLVHVLEHLDQPRILLNQLRQRAGALVIEVPDLEADSLNLVRAELGSPLYTDADHVREYTLPALRADVEAAGWYVRDAMRSRGGTLLLRAVRGE